MSTVHDQLREAAKTGDADKLRALLRLPEHHAMDRDHEGTTALMSAASGGHASCIETLLPVSDSLAVDPDGWTALIYAAYRGHTSCTELLIPVSDALAKDKHGKTASELARNAGCTPLASFIDAYTLAHSEISTLGSLVTVGATRKKASLRV